MKRPAFQFYAGDWIHDAGLRICSLASRGLWIDMLAIMHQSEPYGHLIVNGKAITNATLARMVGAPSRQITKLLKELGDAGVYSRTENGAIYSRRMVRDEVIRQKRAAGGKLGGNPTLMVKHKVNLEDNQTPTFALTPSSSSSSSKDLRVTEFPQPDPTPARAREGGNGHGLSAAQREEAERLQREIEQRRAVAGLDSAPAARGVGAVAGEALAAAARNSENSEKDF